ncbi:MAG: flagellar biosynthetic protein FliR [Gammaproteobacteria bacterium]
MNTAALIPFVYERFILFILVFTRISALFATFVFFRRDIINPRTLIALSSILSIYVILFDNVKQVDLDVFSIPMVMQAFLQFFIGFIAGLILNIIFEMFTGVGQIISTQIGLSLASVLDPRLGSITNLTQFYTFSMTLIFLFLNGHLFIIKTIVDSFIALPVTHHFIPSTLISDVVNYSGIIFSGAVMLSITVIVAILITNCALAVMTRFAPQFNLFSIGINMTLILGLICIYMTFQLFIDKGTIYLQEGLTFMQQTIVRSR